VAESTSVGKHGVEYVEGVSDAHDHLVRVERECAGSVQGVVGFDDPDAFVGDVLAAHAEDLQAILLEGHVGSSLDASDEVEIPAKAGVTGAWICCVGDSLTDREALTVKEPSFSVKDFVWLLVVPQSLNVVRFKRSHQLSKIDRLGLFQPLNSLRLLRNLVASIMQPKNLRKRLVPFNLLRGVSVHLLINPQHIFPEKIRELKSQLVPVLEQTGFHKHRSHHNSSGCFTVVEALGFFYSREDLVHL